MTDFFASKHTNVELTENALAPSAAASSAKTERAGAEDTPVCNICGGRVFLEGPGRRLSDTGKLPRCAACQSLERHRTLRQLYDGLRSAVALETFSCIQISDDRSVEPTWFATHAISIFEKQHSLDIQSLPIASGAFDCVICNHVLEHVRDDMRAMSELIRLVSDRGFAQIGVPDPLRLSTTEDWGYPRKEDHGHFRKYGIDIVEKFKRVIHDMTMVRVIDADPVTGMKDLYFIFTRSNAIVDRILGLYPNAIVDRGVPVHAMSPSPAAPYLHCDATLKSPARFFEYVVNGGHQKVQGGVTQGALSAITAFNGLQRQLGVKGHVCEIGVHHGRLFLAISLMRQLGEKSLAIDVFDMQEFNVDDSGKGDRDAFDRNVQTWLNPDPDVMVMCADSLRITSEDVIRTLGGKVRLFSVDGSHTYKHTLSDMRVSEGAVVEGGLVVVDNFLNPAWPGVIEAVLRYLDEPERATKLAPIGYGDNKFYLTTKSHIDAYRKLFDGWLRQALIASKPVTLAGADMLYFSFPPADHFLAETTIAPGKCWSPSNDADLPLASLGEPTVPEKAGAWMLGEWSGIALDVSQSRPDAILRVSLTMHAFRHGKDPTPCIAISVFDRHVTDVTFSEGQDEREVVIDIDRKLLGPGHRCEIWFQNPRTASPKELQLSRDGRRLSFLLKGVRLEETQFLSEDGHVEPVAASHGDGVEPTGGQTFSSQPSTPP